MSFYEELSRVRDEYENFQRLEQFFSSYSPLQAVMIIKTLLENYEYEDYDVSINEYNRLIASPKDEKSKSLKLEISNLYNGDVFYKSMNRVLIFPYNINNYINVSSFQSDMQIHYLRDFFTSLVEYRYSNNFKSIEDSKLISFLDEYIDMKKEDIISYQGQKKKWLDEYIKREKERKIKALFMVDKYSIINCVKDIINENYSYCVNIFNDIEEGETHYDNMFECCNFYRNIGLKTLSDEVIFQIKELSYVDKKDLDDYYSHFCYCGSKCIDREINVYLLRYKMKKLIERYPKLNDFFDNLEQKYRELLKDNSGIVDSKKIKKLVGKTF